MAEKNYRAELVGVFGDPVDGNPTGVVEEAGFAAAGLNWRYLTCRVPVEKLADAMKGMRAMDMKGINLTMPHKVAVLEYLDELSEAARIIGAVNTVAGMILDYRAFDTLGESFVLFTAMCAVTVLMNLRGKHRHFRVETETVDYHADPIVRTMCKFVIPVILVFGIYILLNGHLSPGGGFSGGAILASAFIIFAMVWGEERASRTIRVPVIKGVTLCALGFYALSKTYSFFTGANHLHSIISPGVPGRILSAGLILPLNVAVGFVVCCTMYSFYMYFRRGEL